MKKTILIIATLFLMSCGSSLKTQKAEKHNFDDYKGKKISLINYSPNDKDGNIMFINFTDGTILRIYSETPIQIVK